MKYAILLLCMLAIAGCAGSEKETAGVTLECRFVEENPGEGLTAMTMTAWGATQTYYAHDEVVLSGADVASAAVVAWQDHPAVELRLTEAGGENFASLTADNVGRRMGMIVDGTLMTAPVIRARIDGGVAVINGEFTEEEAKRVAEGLCH